MNTIWGSVCCTIHKLNPKLKLVILTTKLLQHTQFIHQRESENQITSSTNIANETNDEQSVYEENEATERTKLAFQYCASYAAELVTTKFLSTNKAATVCGSLVKKAFNIPNPSNQVFGEYK